MLLSIIRHSHWYDSLYGSMCPNNDAISLFIDHVKKYRAYEPNTL